MPSRLRSVRQMKQRHITEGDASDAKSLEWRKAHEVDPDLYRIPNADKRFFHSRSREPVVQAVIRHATEHSRVVEIGCGSGADSVCLALAGLCVTALDISPHMLDAGEELLRRAQEVFPERTLDITFALGDIFDLADYRERFDIALSFAVIQIWASREKRLWALRNMRETLVRGGVLCIVATHTRNPLFRVLPVASLVGDMADYDLSIFAEELETAGFALVSSEPMGLSATFGQWVGFRPLIPILRLANHFFRLLPRRLQMLVAPHFLIVAKRS